MNTGGTQLDDGITQALAIGSGVLVLKLGKRRGGFWIIIAAALLAGTMAYAQFGGRRGPRRGYGRGESNSSTPSWKNPGAFKHDVFSFVRIE